MPPVHEPLRSVAKAPLVHCAVLFEAIRTRAGPARIPKPRVPLESGLAEPDLIVRPRKRSQGVARLESVFPGSFELHGR